MTLIERRKQAVIEIRNKTNPNAAGQFTVVGYYPETDQPAVWHVTAVTPQNAVDIVRARVTCARDGAEFAIVEVFTGYQAALLRSEWVVR
jgi:hypothetical protein